MTRPSAQPSGLPRVEERRTFAYFEQSRLHVENSALSVIRPTGKSLIPPTMFFAVFLGGGCSVTTEAAQLLADSGTPVAWVRNGMARLMSSARPLASDNKAAGQQARMWADPAEHRRVVHQMYERRFGDGFVRTESESLRTLQGREGTRVRNRYRELADKYAVPWTGRMNTEMDPASNPVNYGISVAHAMYHGLAACVVFGLGLIPQLGFVHVRSPIALPLDIADMFKSSDADEEVFRMFGMSPELLEAGEGISRAVRSVIRSQIVSDSLVRRFIEATVSVLGLDDYSKWAAAGPIRAEWWGVEH